MLREAWKADSELDLKQKDIRTEIQKAEYQLQSIMPKVMTQHCVLCANALQRL